MAALGIVALLAGCSHTYQVSHPRTFESPARLHRDGSAYVRLPEDGSFQGRTYERSGEQTAGEIARAFEGRLAGVVVADEVEAFEEALASARAGGFDYLVYPEIKHWEERATEWSGKPDQIEVRITVFDAVRGEMLDAVDIAGRSRWGTLGGDHPQELLPEPVEGYVAELFATP